MRTYEVLWSNGYVEMIEAQYVDYPSHHAHDGYRPHPGYCHIKFYRNYQVIASGREGNLISVREISVTVLQDTSEDDKPKTETEKPEPEDKASGDVQEQEEASTP
jgi:hypothetical protein